MRHLIEQAIIHVINGEDAKADALWHKYMVQRARQIHEALNQGDDVALKEGWDDEIASESYFSESDLEDAEDEAPADGMGAPPVGDDMAADAAADLDADLDAEGDAEGDDMSDDMGGDEPPMDGDMGAEGDDMGAEGDVEGRVENLEDQIEKLTAEFEKMMADMGEEPASDDMGDDAEMSDDMGDDAEGDDAEMSDDMGDEEADDAEGDEPEMSDDMGDDAEGDDAEDEEVPAVKEGKLPPALAAHMKKKGGKKADKKEAVEESDEDEDMEDITESVMAELEKVVADLTKDGMEIADGKAITQNTTSPIPQKAPNARDGGSPVKITSKNHQGFEREPAPPVKAGEKRKNTKSGVTDGTSKVPAPSNKDGNEVGNGGTITQNRVSPLARNRNRNSL